MYIEKIISTVSQAIEAGKAAIDMVRSAAETLATNDREQLGAKLEELHATNRLLHDELQAALTAAEQR